VEIFILLVLKQFCTVKYHLLHTKKHKMNGSFHLSFRISDPLPRLAASLGEDRKSAFAFRKFAFTCQRVQLCGEPNWALARSGLESRLGFEILAPSGSCLRMMASWRLVCGALFHSLKASACSSPCRATGRAEGPGASGLP